MNKKIVKVLLFSFILFSCFFVLNKCSAVSVDDIYNYIDTCASVNYYGDNLVDDDVCFDTFNFCSKNNVNSLISNFDVVNSDFSKFTCFYKYFNIPGYIPTYHYFILLYNSNDLYFIPSSDNKFAFCVDGSFRLYNFQYSTSSGFSNVGSFSRPNDNNISTIHFINYSISDYQFISNSKVYSTTPVDYNTISNSTFDSFTFFEANSFEVDNTVTITNTSSNIAITYEYNEDRSNCHVNATITNGSFSDKLYYSYQMPSIASQGLVLGKTAFPIERYRLKS